MTKEEAQRLEAAASWIADGKRVQMRGKTTCGIWIEFDPEWSVLDAHNEYRQWRDDRLEPLTMSDIKPGMVFRSCAMPRGEWISPSAVRRGGMDLGDAVGIISWANLRENWEYSADGVYWTRCEKDKA